MAFTKPIFSLGFDIPNCALQIPGDASGYAAGWTSPNPYAFNSSSGVYTGSKLGRSRLQLCYSLEPTFTRRILSGPSSPLKVVPVTNTLVVGVLDVYTTGNSTGNSLTQEIRWYNASGTELGAATLQTLTTNVAEGVVHVGTPVTINVGATTSYFRTSVTLAHTQTGAQTVYLTFAGVGLWDGNTTAYFQPSRFPVFPGSTYRQGSPDAGRYRSAAGIVRSVDRTRHARAGVASLGFTAMPHSDYLLFQKLDMLNNGRNWDQAASAYNPSGGGWPILLAPGATGFPAAMLCDLAGLALEPDADWGRSDPPLWQGSLEFSERT